LIVVALSILKVLCGQKVDIITSSSVLAKRDSKINSDIYDLFSVSVSHNCDDDVENRKEVYSWKDIIYGELSGFQRDYLLDQFYGTNILGRRSFENVIIDEMDSMLLDKGNNMLYLSHDLPCLDKLESVYVYIWQPDLKTNITIIDRDTGTEQTNSQWDEALHQFLQLKHGCRLSTQSLKAVFVSNVSYLKFYSKLYGLTGTLGSQWERDLLRHIYQVDFVMVPTTKMKKFEEYNPIICSSLEEWRQQICSEADTYTKAGRSVLIICETVQDVESLYRVLGAKNMTNLHTYTRDCESFGAATKHLCESQIIIATNLAGRGTDIK
ncbi:Protein translocase subunit secA 2, partial [Harpegnathos saltator]